MEWERSNYKLLSLKHEAGRNRSGCISRPSNEYNRGPGASLAFVQAGSQKQVAPMAFHPTSP